MAMSLSTPEKIRTLQRKLYCKAKAEPAYRFYALYDKICREDILHHAWEKACANAGAPGVDGVGFVQIEASGVAAWLAALREELVSKTYRPQAVRRVEIPKPGGGERPLGIPTIRDRVVQTAAKLVLEPIFEADMEDSAYGYRPKRGAGEAIRQVHQHLIRGYTDVVDADLSRYFDSIPHPELMKSVSRRICDRPVLHLIRMWLKAPVEEEGEDGTRTRTGGKHSKLGTPQGGVVSPLLANLYMNRFLKHWRLAGCGEMFRAQVVNYADDFVILSRGCADEALAWTAQVMARLGLTLNEAKTSLRDARNERFDFLGYAFGPHHRTKDGSLYTGASPSNKSLKRLKDKVSGMLVPGDKGAWPDVRDRLNGLLAGWSAYFGYGSVSLAYQAADHHVVDRVRHFLASRHKVQNSGTIPFSRDAIFGEWGVRQLRCVHRTPRRGPGNEATRKAGCGKSARPV